MTLIYHLKNLTVRPELGEVVRVDHLGRCAATFPQGSPVSVIFTPPEPGRGLIPPVWVVKVTAYSFTFENREEAQAFATILVAHGAARPEQVELAQEAAAPAVFHPTDMDEVIGKLAEKWKDAGFRKFSLTWDGKGFSHDGIYTCVPFQSESLRCFVAQLPSGINQVWGRVPPERPFLIMETRLASTAYMIRHLLLTTDAACPAYTFTVTG